MISFSVNGWTSLALARVVWILPCSSSAVARLRRSIRRWEGDRLNFRPAFWWRMVTLSWLVDGDERRSSGPSGESTAELDCAASWPLSQVLSA